jgi:hypothetical protein
LLELEDIFFGHYMLEMDAPDEFLAQSFERLGRIVKLVVKNTKSIRIRRMVLPSLCNYLKISWEFRPYRLKPETVLSWAGDVSVDDQRCMIKTGGGSGTESMVRQ